MKNKLLATLFISVLLFFTACDEDSITDAILGSNSITLSGDINKSFDATSAAGMIHDDSISVFAILMQPENSGPNSYEDNLTLMKQSDALPAIGKYNIGYDENSSDDFMGFYGANDTTMYMMYSGSVEITESNTSKIAGTFNMTGYYGFIFPDSTRELKITGNFSTIPIEFTQ